MMYTIPNTSKITANNMQLPNEYKMESWRVIIVLIGITGVCHAQLGRFCDDTVSLNCPFDPSTPGERVPCYARPLPENAPADEPNFVCDCTSLQRIDFDCGENALGTREFITCYGNDCRSGSFESRNYPNHYPHRWFATYLLYIPGASRIDFRFTGPGFGIESYKDELWVGTGLLYTFDDIDRANSSNLVEGDFELRFFDNRTLMGNMFPPAFSLNTDTVMLFFATGRNIRWVGFRLQWNAVVDDSPPLIMGCPMHITVQVQNGQQNFTEASWIPPMANDISPPVTSFSSHQPGDIFIVGQTEVIYTFRDRFENEATCSFFVNVGGVDTTPPAIIGCPSAIIDTVELGTAGAFIDWTAPTSFDVSNAVSVDESHSPGTFFVGGTTRVTYLFTDETGNSALCSFCVELLIIDTEPPVVSGCPQDQNLVVELGTTSAQAFWIVPSATDRSGSVEITTESHQSGDSFFFGMTTVMYAFSDPTGNTDVCTFVITVSTEDKIAPTIDNCPSTIVETIELGLSGTTIVWTEPKASDVSGVVMQIERSHQPGDTFQAGVTSVTYRFSDNSDNVAVCSFLIFIHTEDTTPPTIRGCPSTIREVVELGLPDVVVSYAEPTATDLSPPVLLISSSHSPNSLFAVGTTTVTYIFQDNVQNEATCAFEVTVVEVDTTPPAIIGCPSAITDTAKMGTVGAFIDWPAPTSFDVSNAVSVDASHSPGAFFIRGTTTVTYLFTDETGNSALCSFCVELKISTVDTEPPVILGCPQDQNLVVELGTLSRQAFWIVPTATDLSGQVEITTESHQSGDSFFLGMTTVMYAFSDPTGNTDVCTFVITVSMEDTVAPTIVNCPGMIVETIELGLSGTTVVWTEPTASDVSGVVMQIEQSHQPGETFPVGVTSVAYRFSDNSNNVAVCSFLVFIQTEDTTPPTIRGCPNTIVEVVDLGLPDVMVSYTEPTATDLSPPVILISNSHSPNSRFSVGITTVTYIFEDNAQNEATCTFEVTVVEEDTMPPTLAGCPGPIQPILERGSPGNVVSWVAPTATDNSGTAFLLFKSDDPGDFFSSCVQTSVTYIFIDGSGNTATCRFCIEFTFAPDPQFTINCINDITRVVPIGRGGTVVHFIEPTATGKDLISLISASHRPGQFFPIGATEVTYVFRDSSGNTKQCTFLINVEDVDTTPPDIINCPDPQPIVVELGLQESFAYWVEPTATDNSGEVSLQSRSHAPGQRFPVGKTTVVYVFVDSVGLTSTCFFDICVNTVDTTPPEIMNCPTVIQEYITPRENSGTVVTWTEPTASDASGIAMIAIKSHVPGSFFPVGSTEVSYTFVDGSGLQAVCSFMVVITIRGGSSAIVDTRPDIDCPSDVIQTSETGSNGTTVFFTKPTVRDDSGSTILIFQSHISGSFFFNGNTTVTHIFEDQGGNRAICSFVITVVEGRNLIVNRSLCQNRTVEASANAFYTQVEVNIPNATLNGMTVGPTSGGGEVLSLTATTYLFSEGSHRLIYNYEIDGLTATCDFTIVVVANPLEEKRSVDDNQRFLVVEEGSSCLPNTCLNGGQCLLKLSHDTTSLIQYCQCTKGWTGPTCERSVSYRNDLGETITLWILLVIFGVGLSTFAMTVCLFQHRWFQGYLYGDDKRAI